MPRKFSTTSGVFISNKPFILGGTASWLAAISGIATRQLSTSLLVSGRKKARAAGPGVDVQYHTPAKGLG